MGFREGFHLDPLHAAAGLAVRPRDDGFIQGDFPQLLRLVFVADCESLSRCAHFEQCQQRMCPAHGVHARSNRPDGLPNRLALGVLDRFGQFPAVGNLRAGGMKRFECGFRFPGFRADAQREARPMDSPVIRVEIGIDDLKSGARLEDEPADRAMIGQPAAYGAKIGGRELPFYFAFPSTRLFPSCGVGA